MVFAVSDLWVERGVFVEDEITEGIINICFTYCKILSIIKSTYLEMKK